MVIAIVGFLGKEDLHSLGPPVAARRLQNIKYPVLPFDGRAAPIHGFSAAWLFLTAGSECRGLSWTPVGGPSTQRSKQPCWMRMDSLGDALTRLRELTVSDRDRKVDTKVSPPFLPPLFRSMRQLNRPFAFFNRSQG